MDGVAGDGREGAEPGETPEHRHLKRLALARLFRLMSGLMKEPCPTTQYGLCYWCGQPLKYSDRVWISDLREAHSPTCPWVEVIDYKKLDDEWRTRDGGSEARVPEGDGDHPGGGV